MKGQKTREAIYRAIISYIEKNGYPPSNREIGKMVGLKSTSSVHTQLLKMKELGMIETDETFGASRAIRVPGYKFVRAESHETTSN